VAHLLRCSPRRRGPRPPGPPFRCRRSLRRARAGRTDTRPRRTACPWLWPAAARTTTRPYTVTVTTHSQHTHTHTHTHNVDSVCGGACACAVVHLVLDAGERRHVAEIEAEEIAIGIHVLPHLCIRSQAIQVSALRGRGVWCGAARGAWRQRTCVPQVDLNGAVAHVDGVVELVHHCGRIALGRRATTDVPLHHTCLACPPQKEITKKSIKSLKQNK